MFTLKGGLFPSVARECAMSLGPWYFECGPPSNNCTKSNRNGYRIVENTCCKLADLLLLMPEELQHEISLPVGHKYVQLLPTECPKQHDIPLCDYKVCRPSQDSRLSSTPGRLEFNAALMLLAYQMMAWY